MYVSAYKQMQHICFPNFHIKKPNTLNWKKQPFLIFPEGHILAPLSFYYFTESISTFPQQISVQWKVYNVKELTYHLLMSFSKMV